MTQKLDANGTFPEMTIASVDGGEITLPVRLESGYQVVLFYRGSF